MKKFRMLLSFFLLVGFLTLLGCLSSSKTTPGSLSGYVTDANGKALSGVRVSTPSGATYSDTAGFWLLEGLEPNIYTVTAARDGYETLTRSVEVITATIVEEVNFSLAQKGALYGVNVSSITSTGAVVTFNTQEKGIGHVQYGTNTLYEKNTLENASATTVHQFTLSALTPATTYHFICVATDPKGRTLRSSDNTFTTLYTQRGDPPTSISAAKVPYSDTILVTWNSDTGADFAGYRVYRGETASGPFSAVDSGAIQNPAYYDTNVSPGEKVFYRVTRVSGTGEESPPSQVASILLPGTTRRNVVWTAERGPYILDGDLIVKQDCSLTITGGTAIQVAATDKWDTDSSSDRKVEIKVNGTLVVQGTDGAPVTMTSYAPNPQAGDWVGIGFTNLANLNTSSITGLSVSFAIDGLRGDAGIPAISSATFRNCSEAGIECRAARSAVSISNATADTCTTGILVASSPVSVKIDSCLATRCFYGIVSRDNSISEITNNRVRFWSVTGIEVGNASGTSQTRKNVVGPGSNGTGIVARGRDEVRRNTVQAQIGIEIAESARASLRSNLILADASRYSIGVLYTGTASYSPASHTIQANDVWNITASNTQRYRDLKGAVLAGVSSDRRINPTLYGGDPFVGVQDATFDYRPMQDSQLKSAGYGGEDIGAYDVP